jgi:UDP-N-acetylmuramoylalanine--D-glutamate ligase
LAAVTLADAAGVDDEAMVAAIRAFGGVPHRLEIVGVANGVQYVNDSIATAPERALAAMDAFDEPIILLAGGRDKEMVWDEWARRVSDRARSVVLFGELAGPLSAKLAGQPNVIRVDTLAEAVAVASRQARPGDVVLLSPGGTSFDAFTDFAERGEAFRELVNAL